MVEVDQARNELTSEGVCYEGWVANRNQQSLLPAHGYVQAVIEAQVPEETACLQSRVVVAGRPVRLCSSNDGKEYDVELHPLKRVDGSNADLLVVVGDRT
jgi:hypothetical protein